MKAIRIRQTVKSSIFTKFNKKSKSEKMTYVLYFIYFLILALLMLTPIWITFINSFKTLDEYYDPSIGAMALPRVWQFESWSKIFTEFQVKGNGFWIMLFNSLWILIVKVFVNVMSSTLLAYCVSRFRFPGKNFIFGLVIFVQTVPIIGTGAAGYKLCVTLNLINNPWLIWITWAVGFDFAFIILYGTFKGISMSYSEAAKIDGAGQWCVLFRIVLPQAMPAVIALAVQQSIGVWNNYMEPMIYLRNYPNLAYGLYMFETECSYVANAHAVYSAAIVLCMIPVITLYACCQKLILTNITTGGLKG